MSVLNFIGRRRAGLNDIRNCLENNIKQYPILSSSFNSNSFTMVWNWCILMLVLFGSCVNGNIGDYHPSSSAAFDEGKLASISRFYPIGIVGYTIY